MIGDTTNNINNANCLTSFVIPITDHETPILLKDQFQGPETIPSRAVIQFSVDPGDAEDYIGLEYLHLVPIMAFNEANLEPFEADNWYAVTKGHLGYFGDTVLVTGFENIQNFIMKKTIPDVVVYVHCTLYK